MPAVTGRTRHGSCIMVYAQLYCSQSIASSRPPPFARFPLLEGDVGGPPSLEGSVLVREGRDRREAPAICFAGEERERPCAGRNREMSKTPFPKIRPRGRMVTVSVIPPNLSSELGAIPKFANHHDRVRPLSSDRGDGRGHGHELARCGGTGLRAHWSVRDRLLHRPSSWRAWLQRRWPPSRQREIMPRSSGTACRRRPFDAGGRCGRFWRAARLSAWRHISRNCKDLGGPHSTTNLSAWLGLSKHSMRQHRVGRHLCGRGSVGMHVGGPEAEK